MEFLLGKTIRCIRGMEAGSDQIVLTFTTGEELELYHDQDCCETVNVVDVCGDPADLIGSTLTLCSETISRGAITDHDESTTWTFYKFPTIKGYVTVRWFGSSNGYYSASVDKKLTWR